MSLQDDVRTTLRAHATLLATATGGIHVYDDLGSGGLTPTSVPATLTPYPFDTQKRLKYVVVIRERNRVSTSAVHDEEAQHSSYLQAVEIGFFADRLLLYSVVETMQLLVYGLLHDRNVGTARLRLMDEGRMDRAYTLNNAIAVYSIYDGVGVLTP